MDQPEVAKKLVTPQCHIAHSGTLFLGSCGLALLGQLTGSQSGLSCPSLPVLLGALTAECPLSLTVQFSRHIGTKYYSFIEVSPFLLLSPLFPSGQVLHICWRESCQLHGYLRQTQCGAVLWL